MSTGSIIAAEAVRPLSPFLRLSCAHICIAGGEHG